MASTPPQLRSQVIALYKNLLYMGRDYPKGYGYFRDRLKAVFIKNSSVTNPEQIRVLIGRGEFVIKELEALYMLRKYRALKHRYYEKDCEVGNASATGPTINSNSSEFEAPTKP